MKHRTLSRYVLPLFFFAEATAGFAYLPSSSRSVFSVCSRSAAHMTASESEPLINSGFAAAQTERQQWDVERYQDQHSFVWKYGASLVDMVFDEQEIKPGDRILDVGCGSGELTAGLYHKAGKSAVVVGMDSSADMIEAAKTQYPHVDFFKGDVRNFELPVGDKVDVIFSNAALHWIPPDDVDRAVAAMSFALSKGGKFIVEFGGKGNVEKITEAVRHVQSQSKRGNIDIPQSYHGWYFPSIAEFTSLLDKHGIEVTSATLYDRATPLDDGINGVGNWLRMFGSHLLSYQDESENDESDEYGQPENHELVIHQVEELLKEQGNLWNEEEQQWTADYRRIRVVGQKL